MTVLIVDDQPDVVRGEQQGIDWEKLGIGRIPDRLQCPRSAGAAAGGAGDILLCDIEMPPHSGLELLSLIREQKLPARCVSSCRPTPSLPMPRRRCGWAGLTIFCSRRLTARLKRRLPGRSRILRRRNRLNRRSRQKRRAGRRLIPAASSPVASAIDYIRKNLDRDISRAEIAEAIFLNLSTCPGCSKRKRGLR